MKNILISILFLLIISISYVSAEDSIYIVSGEKVIKQGAYKIIALENISSDLMIDSNQIYFFTKNHEYIVNSTNGTILYKIQISNINEQKQTDNYLFLKTSNSIYAVRKNNGSIENQYKYNFGLDSIFSLFGLSTGGTGSTTINNYYNYTNISNGSDPTKLNLSGGTMTGDLSAPHLISQYSSQGVLPLFIDNPEDGSPTGGSSSKYLAQFSSINSSASATFHTRSPNPNTMQNIFSAISTNGTTTSWYGLPANQIIFWIGARGSSPANDGSGDGSKATILLKTGSQQWTDTSKPTKIELQTTPLNSVTRGTAVTIDETKNMTVAGLAGTGNRPICANSSGALVIC